MAWRETQPGLWQRPIGENEAMIKMIGDAGLASGKDVWSISATAHFTGSVEPKSLTRALRDGWAALRFRHPSIAAVADSDTLLYRVPDASQLAQWLGESFMVLSNALSADQVLGTLPPRRFACCYYLEQAGEVVLHLSHWRTDGIGAFHLLGALFSATVEHLLDDPRQLPWGQETVRLVPSVEQALMLPTTPTKAINEATQKYLGTLDHAKGALGIPSLPQPTADTHTTTRRPPTLRFPAAQTAKLLSACARLGISLEAALHASVTAAAYSLASPSSSSSSPSSSPSSSGAPQQQHPPPHHSSTLRHSLRPHLPAPYDGAAGAAGLYTAGYLVRVPASQSWLDHARHYAGEYARGATPALVCSRRQYAREMRARLLAASGAARGRRSAQEDDPGTPPPPSGLDVSWVPGAEELVGTMYKYARSGGGSDDGDDDDKRRFVRVERVGISVDVLSRHVYVFAWMFSGEVQCRLAFNRDFYDDDFADKVLGLVARHLTFNLGVGECEFSCPSQEKMSQ